MLMLYCLRYIQSQIIFMFECNDNMSEYLSNDKIQIIKILIEDVGATNIHELYDYPRDKHEIIRLLEIGLNIKHFENVTSYTQLTYDIKGFNDTTYNELYQYMPKELASVITEYCLL